MRAKKRRGDREERSGRRHIGLKTDLISHFLNTYNAQVGKSVIGILLGEEVGVKTRPGQKGS